MGRQHGIKCFIKICSIFLVLILLLCACENVEPTATVPVETLAPTKASTATPTPKATATPYKVPEAYEITDFPIIYQNPELPTGCEITALTMMLQYYEYDVDKITMAEEYLPVIKNWKTYIGEDGKRYGPDLYNYFVGDPATLEGTICGAGAIQTAADLYFSHVKSNLQAKDITGTPVETLYEYVSLNIPVFACATVGMKDRWEVRGSWYTEDGRQVDWANRDHGVVLIGYSDEKVTIADPISGLVTCERAQFEKVYEQRGCQAVILQ